MSSNKDCVSFTIPFHNNCPHYVQYTKNIRQIELETHTNIELLQIVRISGNIKNIKQADQRVSQLNENVAQNEIQDGLKNEVHILKSKFEVMENIYEQKIKELTNALTNFTLQIKAINIKTQENVQNEDLIKKDVFQTEMSIVQSEIQEIKNKFEQKIQELTNAMNNSKLQIEAISTKTQENEDWISDEELENFCKSEECVDFMKCGERLPLHAASHLGRIDVVKKMIKNGVDVNSRADADWTPLILAALGNHKAIVEYLISKNADVNIRDKWNQTALSLARSREIIEILINHGATK